MHQNMSQDTSRESLLTPHLIILYTISGTESKKKKLEPRLKWKMLNYDFLRTYSSHLNQNIFALFCKTK